MLEDMPYLSRPGPWAVFEKSLIIGDAMNGEGEDIGVIHQLRPAAIAVRPVFYQPDAMLPI
jgi:hypothetical protein